MDAINEHLERIHSATQQDWHELLELFTEQCEPSRQTQLGPVRTGRVPDEEWERSEEYRALAHMLARCWPSERSQRQ
jgi:hypothetical protein